MKNKFFLISNCLFLIGIILFFIGLDDDELNTIGGIGLLAGIAGTPGTLIQANNHEHEQIRKRKENPRDYTNELITEATKHLSPGEKIEKYVTFVEVQIISLAEDKFYGIAIATNTRIFIYKFTLGGHKIKSLNYSKVSAVEYEQGLLFDSLEFSTSGEKLSIDKINKGSTAEFVSFVNSKI